MLSAFVGSSGGIALNDSITKEYRVERDVEESAVPLTGDTVLELA